MDHLFPRAHGRPLWLSATKIALPVIVVIWWLVIAGTVVSLLPQPPAEAAPTPYAISAGMTLPINQPGSNPFPIAVERAAFDQTRKGTSVQDESLITQAFETFEWIDVSNGQPVRVLAVDGEAVQVELLEGANSGRHGWLRIQLLGTAR